MEAFAWLGQIVEFFGKLVPRLIIVKATEGGVKWVHGAEVVALLPGLHVYWPIVTEYQVIITARQTTNLKPQTLTTADGHKVVVGAVVVYRIRDVVLAIGRQNWDVDETVADIAQAAVVGVVQNSNLSSLMRSDVEQLLTSACRSQLKRYGISVSRCAFTDLAEARVFRLVQG